MSTSEPLAPTTLQAVSTVEALVAALREQILEGTLPPGTPLREADVCEAFNVSRHTVRTGLRALTHEGLVRHEANRGAFIPTLTPADVVDIYRLRTLIELEAVRSVSGDLEALRKPRETIERLRSLGPDVPWGVVRDCDLDFHDFLVNGLRSPRARQAFASLRNELRLCFLQVKDELSDAALIVRQHEAVLNHLERGNTDKALALMRVHLDEARDKICVGFVTAQSTDAVASGSALGPVWTENEAPR
jgi:DNA-binding GntR family transcriptional regulator